MKALTLLLKCAECWKADDNGTVRSALVRMLKADAGLEVIGEAATLAETFELVDLPKPDTVLIDLHMPDETLHAPEAAEVKMLQNAGCILAISVWNDYEAKALAEQFGAKRH